MMGIKPTLAPQAGICVTACGSQDDDERAPLVGLRGSVDPALVLVACYLRGNEAGGGRASWSSDVVRRDRGVDVAGDDEEERARCRLQRCLGARGVEQPEGGIECFAEVSVVIVVDVPGAQDDADSELAVRAGRMREAGVVGGQDGGYLRCHRQGRITQRWRSLARRDIPGECERLLPMALGGT